MYDHQMNIANWFENASSTCFIQFLEVNTPFLAINLRGHHNSNLTRYPWPELYNLLCFVWNNLNLLLLNWQNISDIHIFCYFYSFSVQLVTDIAVPLFKHYVFVLCVNILYNSFQI